MQLTNTLSSNRMCSAEVPTSLLIYNLSIHCFLQTVRLLLRLFFYFNSFGATAPNRSRASSFTCFLDYTYPFGAGIFFLILAHAVYKMWIIQEPNKLALWNKLHFEEKKRRVLSMFKIFSTYICWIYKMQRFEVSGAVRPIYGSLGVKRFMTQHSR
jgi:hypothetical protein